jgi:hypothetical protein
MDIACITGVLCLDEENRKEEEGRRRRERLQPLLI